MIPAWPPTQPGWLLLGGLGLSFWLFSALFLTARIRRVPLFSPAAVPPGPTPPLSVVIAARNDAAGLRRTATSVLAQQLPGLELILVDDRSTDGTGELVEELAAADPRVRAEHVRELPPGWLGKVHALHTGLQHATGELVLFSDADARFAPGTLAALARLAQARALDHLTVLPWVPPRGLGLAALVSLVRSGLLATWPPGDDSPTGYAGFGPCNLVRRAAFLQTPGFPALRLELLDDMGVGWLCAGPGHRRLVLASAGEVAFDWYPSLAAMFAGLEKNLFAGLAGFGTGRALGLTLVCLLAPLLPLAAGHPAALPWLWPLLLFTGLGLAVYAGTVRARLGGSRLGAVLLPLGMLLFAGALARSTWAFHRRRGVVWSATFYPAEEVIRGRRVRR